MKKLIAYANFGLIGFPIAIIGQQVTESWNAWQQFGTFFALGCGLMMAVCKIWDV